MKLSYGVYCIIVMIIVLFAISLIGDMIGPGSNEIGYVIVALSITCGLMVACTGAIIDTIKNHKS